MKIYFTGSTHLPKERAAEIIKCLEDLGNKVDHRIRPQSYANGVDLKEAQDIYKHNVKSIKAADVVVSELSFISTALGYEISLALDEKKPVIAIYNLADFQGYDQRIKKVPVTIKGNPSNYLFLKEYNQNNLEKTLQIALNDAKSLLDTKFILILSPKIDRYLEWNVKEKNKPKAVITREAIEKVMLEDKNYQAYLRAAGLAE